MPGIRNVNISILSIFHSVEFLLSANKKTSRRLVMNIFDVIKAVIRLVRENKVQLKIIITYLLTYNLLPGPIIQVSGKHLA